MKKFLITVCLTLLAAITADARVIVREDATGNLTGDKRRSFVDITSVKLSKDQTTYQVDVSFNEVLPHRSELFGTGMQVSVSVHNQPDSTMNTDAIIKAEYTEKGWNAFIKTNEEKKDVQYMATRQTITLRIPKDLIIDAKLFVIKSSTENFPKWRPITYNPPISIALTNNETH